MQIENSRSTTILSSTMNGAGDPRSPEFVEAFLEQLCASGTVDRADANRASAAQKQTNERIDVVLTELGIVPSSELITILSDYFSIPLATKSELAAEKLPDEYLPVEFMRRNHVVQIGEGDDDTLIFAISDPFARDTLEAIAFMVERPVSAKLASRADIEEAIRAIDSSIGTPESEIPTAELAVEGGNAEDVQRLKDIASEAPVIRYVARLIGQAVKQSASDIHIEPMINGTRIRFRIDGVLQEVERVPSELQAGVVSRIKILARLNIAERRLPQDGRTKFVVGGHEIDLRLSTMPTLYGESTVLRILDPSRVDLSFPSLGFDDGEVATLQSLMEMPNGIVLLTGPTGSGKTTTLYAALKTINSTEKKIFTVEDPIEYELGGLNQIQIHPQIGLDFAPALRSILRQDPDIIMIGEMRDLETAQIGIQAALTGHLVLSTLHTNSAAASIMRLLDIGVEDYLVASSLNAVAAQRLVRKLCPDCQKPAPRAMERIKAMELDGIDQLNEAGFPGPHEAMGCEHCNGTGFRGRTIIFEVLEMDDEIRRTVRKGTTESQLRDLAVQKGMRTLLYSGIRKVLQGKTTLEEVFKVAIQ